MQQKIRAILFSFLICICPLTFSGCSNAPAAPADSLISSSSEAETATTQPDTNSHDAVNLLLSSKALIPPTGKKSLLPPATPVKTLKRNLDVLSI